MHDLIAAAPLPGSLTARMPTAFPVCKEITAPLATEALIAPPEPVLAGIPVHEVLICTLSLGQTDEPPREARTMPMRLPLLLKGLVRVVVSVMVPLWLRLMAPPAPAIPQIACADWLGGYLGAGS